jgi:hypothetical protein
MVSARPEASADMDAFAMMRCPFIEYKSVELVAFDAGRVPASGNGEIARSGWLTRRPRLWLMSSRPTLTIVYSG